MVKHNRKKLGNLLIDAGIISREQLEQALQLQKNTGKKVGEILVEQGLVQEKEIVEVLEFQLGIPHMDLDKHFIDPDISNLISEDLARRHLLIPVKVKEGRLVIAMADPLNIFAIDDVKIATGMDVEVVIATSKDILSAIDQYYGKKNVEQAIEEFKKEFDFDNITEVDEKTLSEINNAPVVKLVNSIIRQAIRSKASDIHIEPFEHHVRVRFRIDGELQEIMSPAKSTHAAIVTRIKIMGKMDIAEKRVPQDGRYEAVIDGKEVDLRISSLPTVYGEKTVIRILQRDSTMLTRKQLGFTQHNMKKLDDIIKSPNGIILVTGPTGSGKSTTLYALLRELNTPNKNLITVEDPVEYRIEGINQVPVNNKAGMTFASALRSILRQDPDIIMIGEIRDTETAEIAVRASITGHLVLSTMHTNDTASTVSRLIDMGIEPYLVSSSVVGIIAQRLVKRICEGCKTDYKPTPEEKEMLGLDKDITLHKGAGCSACGGTGYKGRIAVHEIMTITKELRALINKGASVDEIREAAEKQGMLTLQENCRQLIVDGISTIEEMLRVAYSID
mgnify:FL=1